MSLVAIILIALVALFHFYICWFEMFQWETKGPKVFKSFPKDLFPKTRVLAANQGLYNAFLAAGLVWSLFIQDVEWAENVGLFFLGCVVVAGVYGAATASRRVFWVQAVPAIAGIVSVLVL